MIHVLDYGLGNVQAFLNVFDRLGVDAVRARTPEELASAEKAILPGVGSFDQAMTMLRTSGLLPLLVEKVQVQKIPVLGVCVGMQMMAGGSEEGVLPGLRWVDGRVRSFATNPSRTGGLPIPHMGWNDVRPAPGNPLFTGLEDSARFYFLHSYYFDCDDPNQSSCQTHYGFTFDCCVQNDNVFGVQFHPEKSHHWGVTLLKNFASL